MIYSLGKGLLFTHVSRTGGTLITSMLKAQLADVQSHGSQHLFLAEARSIVGSVFDDLYKFAIVRNPWDRFVSWYALIGYRTMDENLRTRQLIDPRSAHWQGFDRFLEDWSAQENQIDGLTHKALSQWAQLTDYDGSLLADRVGRFENFVEDVVDIFSEAGLVRPDFPVLNPSTNLLYSNYYSNFGRELVREIYKNDVEEFNYKFESDL